VDSFIHLEAKDNEQFNMGCRAAVHSLKDEILTFVAEAGKKRVSQPPEDEAEDDS